MQFKLTLVATALAALVVATPTPRDSKCSTGSIQCCSSVQSVTDAQADPITSTLAGLLGIVLGAVTGEIGSTCSSINVAGGGTCTAQTVCCEDNATGGLISVGCAPVTL
ncbi:hydrophobin 2 [Rhodocollybia butyracea]|uniref:Hydrophobin n=1 Tax=Rhodocollybia butyracea TaxID=206335 RepID=A0A9P5PIN4_9AGAR|nr:hydrophobin 2 [Rhodocollybia butyracea]